MSASDRRLNRVRTVLANIRAVNGSDVKIEAKANSPIAKMLGAATVLPRTDATGGDHNALSYIISTTDDVLGISYDEAQHELSLQLTEEINNLMFSYRSEINGATTEIIEDFHKINNAEVVVAREGTGDIVAVNVYQGLWNSVQISNLAEKYNDVQSIVSSIYATFGNTDVFPRLTTFDEVINIMKTGVTNLDKQIREHLEGVLPEESLVNHYNSTFYHNTSKIGERITPKHVTLSGLTRNHILVNYLVIKNALDNWPADVEINLPPIDLKTYMNSAETLCGAALYSVFLNRSTNIKRDLLIYNTVQTNNDASDVPFYTYHVNEQPYRKYIESGGSDEALTSGLFIEGATVDSVLARLTEAERRNATRVNMIAEMNSDRECVNYRISLHDAVFRYYKNASTHYNDIEDPTLFDVHMEEIRTRINKLKATDFECVDYKLRKIISNVLYPNTGAADFFTHMEDAEVINPDGTPRDYAAMAIIEHVCRWASRQLKVV